MVDLSLVIPVYNEERKVAADLVAGAAFLREQALSGELLLVDDGSTDRTVEAAREVVLPPEVPCRVLVLPAHQGKGAAVRTGVLATTGRVVLLVDSGGCVPLTEALPALARIRTGEIGLAIGTRRGEGAVIVSGQPPFRRLGSRLYMGFLHRLAGLAGRFTDTQCGFKLFRGDLARELFAACFTDGFMFDLELLLRALHRGVKVVEFPIRWRCDPDSRLRPLAAAWASLWEVLRIRRALGRPPRPPTAGGGQEPSPPARPAKET